jgi:succinoglycan biosynthesis transport protein ExoP
MRNLTRKKDTADVPQIRFPQDYLYLARKHRMLIGFVLTVSIVSATALIIFVPRSYESTARILIEQPDTGASFSTGAGAMLADLTGASQAGSLETQAEIITSRPQLEKVMNKLNINERVEDFSKRVIAKHPKLTELLEVSATAGTAKEAADIANELASNYRDLTAERHTRDTSGTASDVRRRLEETETKLQQLNKEIIVWLKTHHYSNPDDEFAQILKIRLELEKDQQELKWGRFNLVEQQQAIKHEIKKMAPFVETGHTIGTSPAVNTLQQELADLQIKRARMQYEYQDNQPEVQALDIQIASTKNELKNALRKSVGDDMMITEKEKSSNPIRDELVKNYTLNLFSIKSNDARQKALDVLLPKYTKITLNFPSEVQGLRDLMRRQAVTNTVWSMLMSKFEEMKVREYAAAVRPEIIEPAVAPIRATRPRPVLYMALGLFLGLILSAVAVGLTEAMDPKISTAWDTQRWLGLQTLAAFPANITNANSSEIKNGKISPAAQTLLGRLTLAGAGTEWRVLSVVPANESANAPGLAAALAIAASNNGLRVILVDTRPETKGLKTFFPNEDTSAPQIMPVPPQEAWLASLADWRENTDLIIVDTPPLASSPQACMAVKLSERVLPVIKAGANLETCEESCLSLLDNANAELVGVVLIDSAA